MATKNTTTNASAATTITLPTLHEASEECLIAKADEICRGLEARRITAPDLYGKATARERRFLKHRNREHALPVVREALVACIYFQQPARI